MRLDLVRDAAAAARLPEVLAERCVHSLIERATCRRCVDACPTRAWVIDDERLGIDPARCDGCGLCAPACPQVAIVARAVEPLRVGPSDRNAIPGGSGLPAAIDGTAMLACDRAVSGRSGFPAAIPHRGLEAAPTRVPGAGIVPCIHALGLRDLARLAAAGCGRLIVATGDCDACPRGDLVRLQSRLADLARLLDSRGLPVLRLERLPADRWQAARDAAAPDTGPAIGRRSFLRRGLGLAADQAATAFGLAAAEREGIQTVARLLPDTGRRGALAPVAPSIDPTACTGCDACVRLCPQQAIRLEQAGPEAGALAYRILPDDCTGCGICVDLCADQAVRLEQWVPAAPATLPLREATCARCRVHFHRPAFAAGATPALCPICARRGGTADRLFRLQE
jgi:Pyruvate/2-oxoacid:ferredoxin oxidoreductase delta subunit